MEPTFVIAGGQRCGTTTLYALCDDHPEIHMAKPRWPEPKHFLQEPWEAHHRQSYLERWFAKTGSARAAGEKSTSYLETPGTARRMKEQFPSIKAVFILRHPVERAISNYRFSHRNALENMSLEDAIHLEPTRLGDQPFAELSAHPFAYLRRGHYFEQLQQFFDHFPPTDLKVLLHDDLNERGEHLCQELFAFLGVDPRFVPPQLHRRHNEHPPDDLHVSQALLDEMFEAFADGNRLLEQHLGRDLSAWSKMTPALCQLAGREPA